MSTRRRGPFVSVQLMSRWNSILGLNTTTGAFLRKYPHIFEVFTHPVKRNICCRITKKFKGLLQEEDNVIRELELDNVARLKKLLMMSRNSTLHVHALRLIGRELGLPEDFRESILYKYSSVFKLIDLEVVAFLDTDKGLNVAEIEEWRDREYREKWLSEFETKYSFPINFPTGFKKGAAFTEKLRNWQRLTYLKPYERKEAVRVRTCGGIERFEKRAVGILHKLLSLTVEKMVEVERKMMDVMLLGVRNTRQLKTQKEIKEETEIDVKCSENGSGSGDGDFAIPILERFSIHYPANCLSDIGNISKESGPTDRR
ncbi:hypothetical protein RJ639_029237 [Escallonia herrerae]|uniref:PORR domain-containing protein n=1 Tax=Escallonia herrerae TaxID=1293975 RepID=A0AA88X3W6_9ASTE|nr:hypothetical protein RJ639_029237 [Escallonia herrerae]